MNRKITLILSLLLLGFLFHAKAQCPPNIDWELGTYANWNYYTGSCCPINTPTSGWVSGRHTLTTGSGVDPYGFFPVVSPGGGTYSFKLGNDAVGAQAERARYYVHVPTGGVYSLIYRYAVVLENPAGHPPSVQPHMEVQAFDSVTGTTVPCTAYTYVSSPSIPGFLMSSVVGTGGSTVYYKTWTMGNMKFPGYGGSTVAVDFATGDCGYSGHFGYGYLDMSCGFFANSIIGCASGSTVLAGPDGFSAYAWYDSLTFSTSYGTSQIVTITAPTVTTTYAVIITPYSGYGCVDTLYTRVIPSTLFVTASNDTAICSGTSVPLVATATSTAMPITYLWTPSTGLGCTTCATVTATPTVTTTYTVTTTDANGCTKWDNVLVTVYPNPAAIGGPTTVCPGATITETDAVSGGTWSGSPTTVATIGAFSGIVTGVSAGVFTVTYSTGSGLCQVTRTVTVNAAPPPISPSSPHVCVGSTITLTDATTGGTWADPGYTAFATVGSSSGIVTGIFAGTAIVTYTAPGGCFVTTPVVVDPLPAAITGISGVCIGQTTTLFSSPGGGTWSDACCTSVATVGSSTGVVTGVSAGTALITYTLSTGCARVGSVNVTPLPSPITGSTHDLCVGQSTTVTDTSTGCSWASTNIAIAYIDAFGVITSVSPGVDTITYTNATTGCSAMYTLTVHATPSPITGVTSLCVGSTSLLSDVDPGTWSSTNTAIATVGSSSGLVFAVATGIDTIILTSPWGCSRKVTINVYPLPLPITGPTSLCVGTTITLSDATTPGSFSTSPVVAASITTGGLVTGLSSGTQLITYTEAAHGCARNLLITVNTTPPAITGTLSVCVGSNTTLSDPVSGGTWVSSPTTIATIGSSSGVATGISNGLANITYSVGAGCSTTAVLTVNPLPGAIVPASPTVCVGNTVTLTDPTSPGGSWSTTSSNASVGASTGIVTGLSFGVAVITYTLPTTCTRTITVTINPLPNLITGTGTVCVGGTTTLSDGTGGGTWSSLSTGIATVGATTGVVTGASVGTATIKYTLPTGCFTSTIVTVNPLPTLFSVTGGGSMCAGDPGVNVGLSGSVAGVSYQLMLLGSPVVTPVVGTGSAISFGLQTTAGVYTVVATDPVTGCSRTMSGSATVTVNPNPLPIVGPTAVCVGATVTFTDGMPGGTWTSSLPAVASIVSTTGVATGHITGLSTIIKYTLTGTGCFVTTTLNVSPSPSLITGPNSVCVGACVTFTDTVTGGSWTSSSPTVATVGTYTGSVCGVSSGTATISYSLGSSGCTVTKVVSVTPAPAPITGASSVCLGQTISESDVTPGGAWIVDPLSVGLVTVSPTTGTTTTVTGIGVGVATISYAALGGTGCATVKQITVNALPAPIGGSLAVCQGSCSTLSDATPGGIWSISPTPAATLGATTGLLCGIVTGTLTATATITYTALGCSITALATVNPLPSTIAGGGAVCQGSSITLSASPAGGTWTTSSSSVATVGASTGVVTGGTPGMVTITYTLPTGCSRNINLTVNPVPLPILGPAAICVGQSATFTDPTPGGIWSSSTPAVAAIGATTGTVTGASGGVTTISYTWGGCPVTSVLNVIPPPSPITGSSNVCVGGCTPLADATPGGTWSSSLTGVATINAITGVVCGVSAGTTIISYGIPGTSCSRVRPQVVNPISPILGVLSACVGQTTTLVDTSLGGTWSSASPAIATVGTYTGIVTGVSAGVVDITYTLPTGCNYIASVTINPVPGTIAGPSNICQGDLILYTNPTPGGAWSSTSPGVASISVLGLADGLAPGNTSIVYTLAGTGCAASKPITVNSLPSPITGPNTICIGSTVTLSDPSGPGSWTSSAPAVASIGSLSGVVNALALGTTTITFNLFSTGCATTTTLNVISGPTAITGATQVCQGDYTTLSSTPAGGTWTSANPSVASIGATTGLVYGAAPGVTSITYSLGVGCATAPFTMTVNPIPFGISGSPNLCVGSTTPLTDGSPFGTWTSSDPFTASIDGVTGMVTGVAVGTAIITYTLPTGCFVTFLVNVSAGPAPITGINTVCIGSTTNLSDATPGGVWSSTFPAIGSIDAFGTVYGLVPGTTTISYTVSGYVCPSTMIVTVNPLPTSVTGASDVCQGSSATYTDGVPGGTWSTSDPFTATITPGSGVLTGVVTGIPAPVGVTVTYTLGAGCIATTNVMVDPVPDPISGPTNVCQGQAITLYDATAGGTWSSSSTAVGTVDAVGDVTGLTPGSTTISYSNVYGCSATYLVTVNISPTPIMGSSNVCLGGTTPLTDGVGPGTWFSLNTAVATIDATTGVVTGVSLGAATIVYSMPGGCFVTKVMNVYPLPIVFNVSGGGNHCAGDTGVHVFLSGSTVGVNYMLYRGSTAVGAYPGTGSAMDLGAHTVAGTYTVIGTSTATTCSVLMSGSAVIGITPAVTPAVTLNVSPNDTVCAGTTTSFTPVPVNGGTAPTYQWSVNGSPVAMSGTYSFIPADGDIVAVVMTSNTTCPTPLTARADMPLTVQPFGTPNVSLSLSPNDTVCQGTVVRVTPVSLFAGSAPIYTWIVNHANVGTTPVYTFVPADGDQLYCILNSNYPCRLSSIDTSDTVTVVVDTPVVPLVSINASPGWLVSKGDYVTLTATSPNAIAPTYQWYINGIPVTGATNATFTSNNFSYPKQDSVTCMVTSNGTCVATGHQWVYIEVTTVGVHGVSLGGDISVLPNPNKGEFTIKGSLGTLNDEEVTIEITNMIGQVVHKETVTAKNGKMNEHVMLSSALANGMYMLTLRAADQNRVFHIVIEQ